MSKEINDALRELERLRWPNGPVCPKCGVDKPYKITAKRNSAYGARRGLYKCRSCRRQFTVTTGTPFHGCRLLGSIVSVVSKSSNWAFARADHDARAKDTVWPYGIQDATVDLVNMSVSKRMPEQMRGDVCQELCVEVLSGDLAADVDAIRDRAVILTRRVLRGTQSPWLLSLDYPVRDGFRTIKEQLATTGRITNRWRPQA